MNCNDNTLCTLSSASTLHSFVSLFKILLSFWNTLMPISLSAAHAGNEFGNVNFTFKDTKTY